MLLLSNSFIIAIFWSKNRSNKGKCPTNAEDKYLSKSNLAKVWLFPSTKSCITQGASVQLDLAKINEKSPLSPYVPLGLTEGQKREFTTCFVLSPKKDKFRHALSFCKIMIMTPISSTKVNIFRKNHIPSWSYQKHVTFLS